MMKVSGRRLDREARTDGDSAALALVVIGVDDDREREFGVGELPARRTFEVGAYSARLDVDVESRVGVERRRFDDRFGVVNSEAAWEQLVVDAVEPAQLQES